MNNGIGSKKTYEEIIASRVDKPLEMNDLTANMLVFSNEQRDVLSNSIVGSIDEIPRIETCARLSTSRLLKANIYFEGPKKCSPSARIAAHKYHQ